MSTTTIRLSDELKVSLAEAAERRYAEFLKTGKSILWEEVRNYLKDRLAEKNVKRPVVRELDEACMRYFRAV